MLKQVETEARQDSSPNENNKSYNTGNYYKNTIFLQRKFRISLFQHKLVENLHQHRCKASKRKRRELIEKFAEVKK